MATNNAVNNHLMTWNSVTANTPLVANNGYFCETNAALVFTLPAVAALGDTYAVFLKPQYVGSWTIATANANQYFQLGKQVSSVGGTLSSTSGLGDGVILVCAMGFGGITAFIVTSMMGNVVLT